ncbi:MAG: hypothetical protein BWY09_00215 [Candidatus Hydrogenedentes bacterium ADurb.Bin179]|nr:MAG: hypothetical protein BWY09_00215 [Candidatus Hydrogenedentes bacterium ADurb.Bin179]
MKKNKPEHIADILAQMAQTTPLGLNLEQAKIWEHWEELAGKNIAAHCKAHNVKDGILRVTAESAVWMHKLSYIKWDLLRRINRMAGQELVSDIFIMLATEDKEDETPPQNL